MKIAAVVLAAGLSTRMGTPKMLLPWGETTVLGHVLRTLRLPEIDRRLVIAGCTREAVEAICANEEADVEFNPDFESGEMLSSLQVGLRALAQDCQAALVVLGDQPALQQTVVQAILCRSHAGAASVVVPSYGHRRGHPWMVGSNWWQEILRMRPPETPRDFLLRHAESIEHVEVDSDSILRDIDTPDEYLNSAP